MYASVRRYVALRVCFGHREGSGSGYVTDECECWRVLVSVLVMTV